MSVKVMSLVWDNFPHGGSDKLVMLAMADWCNDQGESLHPSHDAVAKKCCISRSQAVRVIRGLCEHGYLEIIGNQYGGAPGTTKHYRLVISALTGSIDATGSKTHTRRVAPTLKTGSTHATQTTIEPSITISKKTKAKKDPLPLDVLISLGVDEQHAKDWLLVRKTKGAPFTKTALDDVKAQAAKAGITLAMAVEICAKRNWQGFNASWNWNDHANARASPAQSIHEKRANTIAELTGANRNERTNERDITGESVRVA